MILPWKDEEEVVVKTKVAPKKRIKLHIKKHLQNHLKQINLTLCLKKKKIIHLSKLKIKHG
jgi:hypothetical protein